MKVLNDIDDARIVEMLQSGGSETTNSAIRYLHRKVFLQVSRFVKKNKGTAGDGEDIFQDGLLVMYKSARSGGLENCANVEAYLFSVCRNLWLQNLRKKRIVVDFEEKENDFITEDITIFRMMKSEEKDEVRRLLAKIGDGCRQVLVAFYYKKIRMREIAENMGYSSEQVAKNRKYDCLKKLRKLMFHSPLFKNQFEK